MKILQKSVEMIGLYTENGAVYPYRYRVLENGTSEVVSVKRIIERKEEKTRENKIIIYRCQSLINGKTKEYEMKYNVNSCSWELYKI